MKKLSVAVIGLLGAGLSLAACDPTPPPSSAPPTCAPGGVQLSLVNSRVTKNDGAIFTDLQLRNVGTRTCTTSGYPGLTFTDAGNGAIGIPATDRTGGPTPPTLQVAPGHTAVATIHTLAGSSCARPAFLGVTLPGTSQSIRVVNSVPLYYCPSSGATGPQAPPPFAVDHFVAGS